MDATLTTGSTVFGDPEKLFQYRQHEHRFVPMTDRTDCGAW